MGMILQRVRALSGRRPANLKKPRKSFERKPETIELENAVLKALTEHADERGRIQVDKHWLAEKTGFEATRAGLARSNLIRLGKLRKIGFHIPVLVEVPKA